MKKTIIALSFAVMLTGSAFAQKLSADKVPANVKAKFAALYPKVTDVKWEMEKSDYEAGFKEGNTKMSVVIDTKGELKETETAIEVSALPKAAADYLAKTYPNAKITEAAKIVDAKGKMVYEAEVNKKDILFDEKGNLVK